MMRPLAMRGRTGWRPGWRVAAATGVLTALSLAVAPLAASASGAAAVATSAGRAAAVKPASTLPTCPSTQYSYTETREAYGTSTDGQGLDVDEYLPAKSASGSEPPPTVPGVVMVHGGEWIEGNFEGGEGTSTTAGDGLSALAECFAENGYDAFSIDYALTGSFDGVSELSFPQNLQDIQSAITYVKANAGNLETSKILILGQSAGGNLAALAGENAMGISDGLAGVLSIAKGGVATHQHGGPSEGRLVERSDLLKVAHRLLQPALAVVDLSGAGVYRERLRIEPQGDGDLGVRLRVLACIRQHPCPECTGVGQIGV